MQNPLCWGRPCSCSRKTPEQANPWSKEWSVVEQHLDSTGKLPALELLQKQSYLCFWCEQGRIRSQQSMSQPALAIKLETEPQGSCTSITAGQGLGLVPTWRLLIQVSKKGSDVPVVVLNIGHIDHMYCQNWTRQRPYQTTIFMQKRLKAPLQFESKSESWTNSSLI